MKLSKIQSRFGIAVSCQSILCRVAMVLLGGMAFFQVRPAAAEPVVFTLDPTNSAITISGSITFSGTTLPFTEQGPGSLTTHYFGTMLMNLNPPDLQFPGGSMIVALTNGVWEPALGGASGSAPADAAGEINISLGFLGFLGSGTGLLAGRNIKLDLTSQNFTLTNSSFDSSLLKVTYITNSPPAPRFDFRVTGKGLVTSTNGSASMIGTFTNGATKAYLTNSAGRLKLVVPVNVTNVFGFLSPNDTTMILQGQIVATAPASAWSFPLTIKTSGGQVTLTWPSVAGQNFVVQVSTDLHHWNTASGNTAVNGNLTTWTSSLSGAAQFYRVQLE